MKDLDRNSRRTVGLLRARQLTGSSLLLWVGLLPTLPLQLGALALGAVGCTKTSGAGPGEAVSLPESEHPLSGAPAPDFSLAARNGDQASLRSHIGKVVLVDFWATWCDPCRASFPQYQSLQQSYGDQVAVLGISEDDEDDDINRFIEETGVKFPIAWDGDKTIARRYRIESMPMLFVIDKSGLVRFVHSGFRPGDEDQIRAAVDSLL